MVSAARALLWRARCSVGWGGLALTPVGRADGAVLLAAGEELLGQAKVPDDDPARLVDHEVGALDVAVDHAVLVHVVQALERLGYQGRRGQFGVRAVRAHLM